MLAHAFLTATAADQPTPPTNTDMIPLTRNEIAHLLAVTLFTPTHPHQHRWDWSAWRRRRQYHAQRHHYHRREAEQT
jgi:hypothetical protein